MASFTDKVIAITGGASGIGLALAKLLASRGAAVSIADVNASGLAAAQAAILAQTPSARVVTTAVDVRDRGAVGAWIAATEAQLGALAGAANLAGVINPSLNTRTLDETPDEEWEQVIGVNLTGAMVCVSEEVKAMKKAGRRSGRSIVNASSILGVRGSPRASAYAAAKHGVVGLTKSVAREVGEWGIRCNAVAPGVILTPMTLEAPGAKEGQDSWNTLSPLGRPGEPEEVAEMIAWLLSDQSSYATGGFHAIDGGILS